MTARHPIADEELQDVFRRDMEDDHRREQLAVPAADRSSQPADKTIREGTERPPDSSSPDRAAAAASVADGCGTFGDLKEGDPWLVGYRQVCEAEQLLRDAVPLLPRLEWSADAGAIASRARLLKIRIEND